MTSHLSPYLNFRGQAREAMEFYRSVLGGELNVSTFGDFSMPGVGDDEKDLLMHSQLDTAAGYVLMGSDVPSSMPYTAGENDHSVALFGDADSADELHGYFEKLAEGGTVVQPLEQAPWGDSFGMVTDRYGVAWMVNISAPTTGDPTAG